MDNLIALDPEKTTITVDIDGILFDTIAAISHYALKFGFRFDSSSAVGLPITKWIDKHWKSLTHKKEVELWTYIEKKAGFKRPFLVEESNSTMEFLTKSYNLIINSARGTYLAVEPGTIFKQSEHFIDTFFPNIFSSIEFCKIKERGGKVITKSDICRKYNAIAHIEDEPHRAVEVNTDGRLSILYRAPYNAYFNDNVFPFCGDKSILESALLSGMENNKQYPIIGIYYLSDIVPILEKFEDVRKDLEKKISDENKLDISTIFSPPVSALSTL